MNIILEFFIIHIYKYLFIKKMLKQIFLLIFIFTLTTSKNFFFDIPLTKQEQKQLNLKQNASDTIDKIVNLISQLLTLIVERKNEQTTCPICIKTLGEINSILKKYGTEPFFSSVKTICLFLYSHEQFCDTIIEGYGYVLINGLLDKFIKNNYLCQKLKLCKDTKKYLKADDYAKRIIKDKPNKNREKINKNKGIIKILQVSDLHYDLHYSEDAITNCGLPLCCRDKAQSIDKSKSGYFGYVGKCDLSKNLFNSFVDKAYEIKPDFIIWTGDNAPHDTWKSKKVGQDDTYQVTEIIRDSLDKKFQHKIPIYPILGNHEIYPNDEFDEKQIDFYKKMAKIYKKYLNKDAYNTFKKYGYYTMKHLNTNIRIVAINCLLCDTWNYNLINSNKKSTKLMFKWLENVLLEAERKKEYVYILNHFPLTGSFSLEECTKRFIALFDRFEYTIRGIFSGHTHKDDIGPVYRYFNRKKITNLNYISPSLTPFPNVQPSFRVYEVDYITKEIIDYVQYRFDLNKSNKEKKPYWFIGYRATQFYNVSDMTQFEKILSINPQGDYIINEYSGSQIGYNLANNKKAIKRAECVLKTDSFLDFHKCKGVKIEFSEEMAIVGLNYLMSPWEDN